MNILNLIHWPWWTVWALLGFAVLAAIVVLGSIKNLLGWPGLLLVLVILALVAGEVDGARRTLSHYHVKTPWVLALPGIFI